MTMFNATRLLDEEFKAHNINYQINENGDAQVITVPFGIEHGPSVSVNYIIFDQKNDLMVFVSNLVNKVPVEKRIRILEVINMLNEKYRFIKFSLDSDNDLVARVDFLSNTGDESLGPMAFEIFIRIMHIMGSAYTAIAQVLYSVEADLVEHSRIFENRKALFQILDENHDGINIKISKIEPTEKSE